MIMHCNFHFHRYHGELQIAYDGYQNPCFIPSHVIVFNDDLIGDVAFELNMVSFYTRLKRTFQERIDNRDVQSVF